MLFKNSSFCKSCIFPLIQSLYNCDINVSNSPITGWINTYGNLIFLHLSIQDSKVFLYVDCVSTTLLLSEIILYSQIRSSIRWLTVSFFHTQLAASASNFARNALMYCPPSLISFASCNNSPPLYVFK